MMKKLEIILVCCFFLMATGCSCSNKKQGENNEETPVVEEASDVVTQEQVVEGIRFKNASLVVTNGMTSFRVTLENTVTTVKKISHLKIVLKDENDAVLKALDHYDFQNLKKGDTQNLTYAISMDLSRTKKIEYQLEFVGDE